MDRRREIQWAANCLCAKRFRRRVSCYRQHPTRIAGGQAHRSRSGHPRHEPGDVGSTRRLPYVPWPRSRSQSVAEAPRRQAYAAATIVGRRCRAAILNLGRATRRWHRASASDCAAAAPRAAGIAELGRLPPQRLRPVSSALPHPACLPPGSQACEVSADVGLAEFRRLRLRTSGSLRCAPSPPFVVEDVSGDSARVSRRGDRQAMSIRSAYRRPRSFPA